MKKYFIMASVLFLAACTSEHTPLVSPKTPPPANYKQKVTEHVRQNYFDPYSIRDASLSRPFAVMVGSRSPSLPAFEIGNWPAEINLDLRIHGRIQGAGGKGGDGQSGVTATAHGQAGGTAIYVRYPVVITSSHQIWGGGGGGIGKKYSSGGGGGGQGFIAGVGGDSNIGQLGKGGTTETYGGATAQSGRGGTAGQAGIAGRYGGSGGNRVATQGGAAGRAIDGNSFLTFTNGQGDIRGPRIG